MNRIAAILAVTTLFSAGAIAQDTAPGHPMKSFTITQDESGKMPMNMMFQGNGASSDIAVMGAELASPGELVTGVPYTATEVTETTQTLSDGNRIVNKTSGTVARDSQGRVRREMSIGHIGPIENNHKMIFISDPTAHQQEVMEPGGNSATVFRSIETDDEPQIISLNGSGTSVLKKKMVFRATGSVGNDSHDGHDQVKHEDLGTQTIAGVSAQGKRDTITIPAGEIGNERPIEVVSETWYSPELHATVMRKHSDPRVGETVFQLTDIQRTEPDPSLFQVPQDMKVQQVHPKHAAPKE